MSIVQSPRLRQGVAVNIEAVTPEGEYKLRLNFSDGFQRTLDFGPFLLASAHPAVREYPKPEKFSQYQLKDGELTWGDYDLCFPIADLYDGAIRAIPPHPLFRL